MTLHFTLAAWAKMQAYRQEAKEAYDSEVSGMGLLGMVDGKPTITDVKILKQAASSVETEFDDDAFAEFADTHNLKDWCFHWHSHPGNSVSPSTTDAALYSSLSSLMKLLLTAIISGDGEALNLQVHHGGLFRSYRKLTLGDCIHDGIVFMEKCTPRELTLAAGLLGIGYEYGKMAKSECEALLEVPKPDVYSYRQGGCYTPTYSSGTSYFQQNKAPIEEARAKTPYGAFRDCLNWSTCVCHDQGCDIELAEAAMLQDGFIADDEPGYLNPLIGGAY